MKKFVLPFLDLSLVEKKSDNIIINVETLVKKGVAFSDYDSYCSMVELKDKIYFYYLSQT